ncbi:uncharacterized protein LOC124336453 isoform X2 [Daphnia pulicaria]|uniref:uncharacterized protein LOC124336453 isoform X2 n=1 Tax=Daphnia pulicaria TaxID=35523 RepID=UPI001EECECC6|nr:uncharacterized protein LOC124336453 isoform X2 [Daphnia pulicaria]
MFLRFFIAVILLSICDRVLGAISVNVTDSLLTVKNATKLDNSTKPQNESVLSNIRVHIRVQARSSDLKLKLKKLGFNVTDALAAVNSTLDSTSDSSVLKHTSLGGRSVKVMQHLLKHKIKANATHANVSNTSSHLNSTGNSTSDALQMKNASKIVERGVFVVMFDSKALLDIANNTSEDASDASDLFSLLTNSSSVMNETESGKLLDGSNNSNSSASLGEL